MLRYVFNQIEQSLKDQYFEKIEKNKKKLGNQSKKLVDDLFYTDDKTYVDYGDYFKEKTYNNLKDKAYWELDDIFPKEVYEGIDLIIGEKFRNIFIYAAQKLVKFPYTLGYYRRMIRSSNYKSHFRNVMSLLGDFILYTILDLDIKKILKRDFDYEKYSITANENYIFAEIDLGNEELIQILKDMILEENNVYILTYSTFTGIFRSDNKELVELVGKLLLAGKLQEGLRQSICENMDSGTQENFEYMFDLVYDEDLIRFSSVKRAIATFTGVGETYGDRLGKKQLEIIKKLIHEKDYIKTLLASDDNVEVLLGLWYKGCSSIKELIEAMNDIIDEGKRHKVLLVSYYLNIVQDNDYSRKVAKDVIRKYARTKQDYEKNDALEYMACYLRFITRDINWYTFKNKAQKNDVKLEKYYKDKDEAKEFFEIFYLAINHMNKKEKIYSPCIFPWYSVTIDKDEIAGALSITAVFLEGDYIDRVVGYMKDINTYTRAYVLERLLEKPKNENQRQAVVKMLSDISGASDSALEIIEKNNFADEYMSDIEGFLRLKTADVRKNLLRLIYSQNDENLSVSIKNLLTQKDANKRLGALDLLLKCKEEKRYDQDTIKKLLEELKDITSSEQVLVEQILGGKNQDELIKKLYNQDYKFDFNLNIESKGKKKSIIKMLTFKKSKSENQITVKNSIKLSDLFKKTSDELLQIMRKLNTLYIKHEDYEYKTYYNYDTMLSSGFREIKHEVSDVESIKNYPLSQVWEDFYKEEIKDFATLYQLYTLLNIDNRGATNFIKGCDSYLKTMLGFNPYELSSKLEEENLKYCQNTYNTNQCLNIIDVLYEDYKKDNKAYVYNAGKLITSYVYEHFDRKIMVQKTKTRWGGNVNSILIETVSFFSQAFKNLNLYEDDEEFTQAFALKYKLYEMFYNTLKDLIIKSESDDKDYIQTLPDNCLNIKGYMRFVSILQIAKAVNIGLVEKDELYKDIMERGDLKDNIRKISSYIDGSFMDKGDLKNTYHINQESIELVKKEGQRIIDYIVGIELNRGDTPTPYSRAIHSINKVEGIDNLIKILKALGNLKLDRSSWYYSGGDTKQSTLSHLLKVCYPKKEDNATNLKKALSGTDIKTQRLVELAMYSPQWIDILQEHLNWSGLASGCYYFQAHMSDIDKKKEALIAKYTPISIEDLEMGAFDIDWFKSAYKELGKENFEMLYESAKYISDGAKHSRARKFADAVLGNLKIKETQKQISEKRNKDLVASYALIPLAKNKNADMLKRYKFLQKFLKESKQFGAQRRASEAKAVDIALENLARNAGFADVTRLTWSMETDLIDEMKEYFSPKDLGGMSAYISVDEFGKSSLVYEKSGKKLKSLPAKFKKDKYIEKLKEANKNLKEQYSRSKKMLEESMEDAESFYCYEIENLFSKNMVVSPILENLVMKAKDKLGFYKDKSIIDINGSKVELQDDDLVTIAHSLDLYKSGRWSDYQKHLFDNKIKQPFKQVFRELYVKTQDELGKDTTLRYSGNQIQPSKTVALLRGRRWVVDAQEGLQKVYYKQNIIAKIYALADWFSPSEVEAPTLEWVEFYDRKTFKKMMIDDIPELIFTEVMRDVDLVVSIAHIGGVDPQTSHSTIEMRQSIIKFNLPLFKIDNVSFKEKHAIIKGKLADYTVHLGSGLVHQKAGAVINVLPVHSQHRGKLFLPFIDEDPKTAEIMAKIILFAQDTKIKDPSILNQIK